jgi:TrmH family RNA methyltransferase
MISKRASKLINSLKLKKYRRKEGLFLVEGLKSVQELVDSDYEIELIITTEQFRDQFAANDPVDVTERELKSLSTLSNNTTCLAVAKIKSSDVRKLSKEHHLIVLDGISDPGNLGTIVRALDWFGYEQVICSDDCADFYNPKSIAASMGSFTRIFPYYVSIEDLLKSWDGAIYGLDLNGTPIKNINTKEKCVFVMGSESHGISDNIKQHLHGSVTIPGVGKAESLNVSMATSILLYELSR